MKMKKSNKNFGSQTHCWKQIVIPGKSKCISEGHGGAGLACGPASAHCIHSKS